MPGSRGLVVRTPFVPFARGATFGFAAAPGGAALVSGKLGEECGGCHDERHVTVPAMPGAGLAMVQPEIVLGAQEAFLDGPAQACGSGQLLERCSFARIDEIIGEDRKSTRLNSSH